MSWNPVISEYTDSYWDGSIPHTHVLPDGRILFAAEMPEDSEGELLLFQKGSAEAKNVIPFPKESAIGRIRVLVISGITAERTEYQFRIDGEIVIDPASQLIRGMEKFGAAEKSIPREMKSTFVSRKFNWGEGAERPHLRYSDSVYYQLHVRGFTKHRSSGVKKKGTFAGVIEKIPYLESLGVTSVVLMPAYEFDEVIPDRFRVGWKPKELKKLVEGTDLPQEAKGETAQSEKQERALIQAQKAHMKKILPDEPGKVVKAEDHIKSGVKSSVKKENLLQAEKGSKFRYAGDGECYFVNYWGFGPGWYYAPKRSYSSSVDAAGELRSLVKALHERHMELIMEFYFPDGTAPALMESVLVWWAQCYRVDGFFLYGNQADLNACAKSPALSHVKLISDFFPATEIYPGGRGGRRRNLAECNRGFQTDARQMLKGDANKLNAFVQRTRYNPKDAGVINTVTNHDGFTLMDLVSYNDKHNEQNGEENHDGASSEFSWNCGVEGPTRKKEILRLRLRQMKNALALLFFAQGTPMITAGDEFGASQQGNNNPYCFDSELTWLDWNASPFGDELREFVRQLTEIRREHPCLHREKELTGSSAGGFYPDFSCHGKDAWFASFDDQDRDVGLMYCDAEEGEERYLYAAYNFHWDPRSLALPYLPKGRKWHCILSTAPASDTMERSEAARFDDAVGPREILVPGRTILLLEGREPEETVSGDDDERDATEADTPAEKILDIRSER